MNKEQFFSQVDSVKEQVEQTKTKEWSEELKDRIIQALNNLHSKNILVERYKGSWWEKEISYKAISILKDVKKIIDDGVIDSKDKKLVDNVTHAFNKLTDQLDKKLPWKWEIANWIWKVLSDIPPRKSRIHPELKWEVTDKELKEVFWNKIPKEPRKIVEKIASYLRNNFSYNDLQAAISVLWKKEKIKYLNQYIADMMIDKNQSQFKLVKEWLDKAFWNINDPKVNKLKKAFVNWVEWMVESGLNLKSLTKLLNEVKRKYPYKFQKFKNIVMKPDNASIQEFMKIKTWVCRNFASFWKKIFDKLEDLYPSLDIKANFWYVADRKIAHAYNVAQREIEWKIETHIVDFTSAVTWWPLWVDWKYNIKNNTVIWM